MDEQQGRVMTGAALIAAMLIAPGAVPASAGQTPGESRFVSIDDCLKSRVCWKLAQTMFGQVLPLHLKVVEGAMPNRFFPRSNAFAEAGVDADGHFLKVLCRTEGGGESPCSDKRDALEDRLLWATLLKSLPVNSRQSLFDPETFEISAAGRAAIAKIRRRYPDIEQQLAPLVVKTLGMGKSQ